VQEEYDILDTVTRIRHDSITAESHGGGVGVVPRSARLQRRNSTLEAAKASMCIASHRHRTWTAPEDDPEKTPKLVKRDRQALNPGDLDFHQRFEETWKEIGNDINHTVSLNQPALARNRAMTEDLRQELAYIAHRPSDPNRDVKVESLREMGFTTEDLSRVVYDKFKDEKMPDFLDCVSLEAQGGLYRMKEILDHSKFIWFFMLILSVVFNIGYLISMNWTIFDTYIADVVGSWDVQNIPGRIENGGGAKSREKIQEALFDDPSFKANIFGMIADHRTRLLIVNASVLVALWEVTWIVCKLVHVLIILKVICFDPSEYRRFHYLSFFFRKLLPEAGTFSAVKLMAKVHPSLVYNEYLTWMNEPPFYYCCPWLNLRATRSGNVVLTLMFLLVHAFCLIAALSAFAVKMLAVSLKTVNSSYSMLYRLGSILALLNQVMGCVIMDVLLQDRLFLFVFGGQDSSYEDDELAYKNVYETRLVKQIVDDFWNQGQCFRAVVLLATFDHYDLQRLLIFEKEELQTSHRLGLTPPKLARTHTEPALTRFMSKSVLSELQGPLMAKTLSGRSQREAVRPADSASSKPTVELRDFMLSFKEEQEEEEQQQLVPNEFPSPQDRDLEAAESPVPSKPSQDEDSEEEDRPESAGEPQEEPDAELGQLEPLWTRDDSDHHRNEASSSGSASPVPVSTGQAKIDAWHDPEPGTTLNLEQRRAQSFRRVIENSDFSGWADGFSDGMLSRSVSAQLFDEGEQQ